MLDVSGMSPIDTISSFMDPGTQEYTSTLLQYVMLWHNVMTHFYCSCVYVIDCVYDGIPLQTFIH